MKKMFSLNLAIYSPSIFKWLNFKSLVFGPKKYILTKFNLQQHFIKIQLCANNVFLSIYLS